MVKKLILKAKRTAKTQEQVMGYLRKLKPRWRLRVPMRDVKHCPFLYKIGLDIPGNVIQVSESTFLKLLNNGKIELTKEVNNKEKCYKEYGYNGKINRN